MLFREVIALFLILFFRVAAELSPSHPIILREQPEEALHVAPQDSSHASFKMLHSWSQGPMVPFSLPGSMSWINLGLPGSSTKVMILGATPAMLSWAKAKRYNVKTRLQTQTGGPMKICWFEYIWVYLKIFEYIWVVCLILWYNHPEITALKTNAQATSSGMGKSLATSLPNLTMAAFKKPKNVARVNRQDIGMGKRCCLL